MDLDWTGSFQLNPFHTLLDPIGSLGNFWDWILDPMGSLMELVVSDL